MAILESVVVQRDVHLEWELWAVFHILEELPVSSEWNCISVVWLRVHIRVVDIVVDIMVDIMVNIWVIDIMVNIWVMDISMVDV